MLTLQDSPVKNRTLNNLGWKLFNALFPRTLESFARFLPPVIYEIQATNKEVVERLRQKAFSLLETFKPIRNRFMGGTITGITFKKNIHQETMAVTVQGITPGRSKAIVRTVKRSRKTSVVEQRLFNEIVEISINWKGEIE